MLLLWELMLLHLWSQASVQAVSPSVCLQAVLQVLQIPIPHCAHRYMYPMLLKILTQNGLDRDLSYSIR